MAETKHGNSEEFEFEVKVEVHPRLVLSPLLFVAVMESLACETREDLS